MTTEIPFIFFSSIILVIALTLFIIFRQKALAYMTLFGIMGVGVTYLADGVRHIRSPLTDAVGIIHIAVGFALLLIGILEDINWVKGE